jgi:tripartite motif-containing protein 71
LVSALLVVTDPASAAAPVLSAFSDNPSYVGQISDSGGVAPMYPAGGDSDPAGNRYVADSGGDRILRIDPEGVMTVVSATGWQRPRDLALDSDPGNIWVADTTDNQIVELTTSGTILKTFGGAGYVKAPFGIDADASGVYVADTYNNRVIKIAKSDGSRIWAQTACNGAFSRPRDVTVGSDGNVYVADTDHNRIAVLNPATGACLRAFGSSGKGNGQFSAPRALTSDGAGGLWVAEAHNYRLQHVLNDGTFVGKTGTYGVGPGQFNAPACVFMDQGMVDVCDTYLYRIARFTVSPSGAPTFFDNVGGVGPVLGGFNEPFGVAFGPSGELYVTDMFNHRIEKRNSDLSWLAWGTFGTKTGAFQFPRGITVTPDGQTVVITNSENNRIDLYQPNGAYSRSVTPKGTGFGWPHQTALAPDGTFWVADTNKNRVLHLASDGTVLGTITNGGSIKTPRGVAVDSSGNIYVSNSGANNVLKFSPTGTLLATLATQGTGPTNVRLPWNLSIAGPPGDERLLIADGNNNRIVVLTLSGTPITTFGGPGSGPGQFSSPRGVAVNPVDGTIAVADFNNNRISLWR